MSFRTPLAWLNLTHDRRRLLVAVSGVGFAVVLMFMELGFLNALLESTVQLLRKLEGEIVLVSSTQYALMAGERFPEQRLYQAREVEGVASVSPVYLEVVAGVLRPAGERGRPIRVIAIRPDDRALRIPEFYAFDEEIRQSETALADVTSQSNFGIPRRAERLADYDAELNGKDVHLVGHFYLGVDFATNGNLLMTTSNFAKYFPFRGEGNPLSVVDLGVVKLAPGADRLAVLQRLEEVLPTDVEPMLREQVMTREKTFWATTAPIGFVFWVGAVMGFIVGIVICYQIIHADIADHLREFATLKAMGYQSRYFIALVLRQCLYLATLGFVPGILISFVAYWALGESTGLTVRLTPALAVGVFLATAGMCSLSGVLALGKLLAADPAELF